MFEIFWHFGNACAASWFWKILNMRSLINPLISRGQTNLLYSTLPQSPIMKIFIHQVKIFQHIYPPLAMPCHMQSQIFTQIMKIFKISQHVYPLWNCHVTHAKSNFSPFCVNGMALGLVLFF
jgi:hypothetical protein